MAGPFGAISSGISKLIALYRREPAATQTAAAVVYAAGDMIYRVNVQHVGVLSWSVVAAAAVALYGLMVRAQVIPAVKLKPKPAETPVVVDPAPVPPAVP
jgi:hypothetical protein